MAKLLENKEQPPKDYILDKNIKIGKQKINELIKNHDKNRSVIALDENLTKWQRELFFSTAQANIIKKAADSLLKFFCFCINSRTRNSSHFGNIIYTQAIFFPIKK